MSIENVGALPHTDHQAHRGLTLEVGPVAAVVVPLPTERLVDLRRVAQRRRVDAADLAARSCPA